MDLRFLAAVGMIVLVDLVLSGDNALVIGAAASRLPRGRRFFAIIWGGVFAVVFRLILAIVATTLLQVPLLQAIGGAILLIIAIRLLWPDQGTGPQRPASDKLLSAILTILAADATMSLDNVLAVGAIATAAAPNDPNRYIPLLVSGLLFSMLLLFAASALIARLIESIPLTDRSGCGRPWLDGSESNHRRCRGRATVSAHGRSIILSAYCVRGRGRRGRRDPAADQAEPRQQDDSHRASTSLGRARARAVEHNGWRVGESSGGGDLASTGRGLR